MWGIWEVLVAGIGVAHGEEDYGFVRNGELVFVHVRRVLLFE